MKRKTLRSIAFAMSVAVMSVAGGTIAFNPIVTHAAEYTSEVDNAAFQAAVNVSGGNVSAVPFSPGSNENGIDLYDVIGWSYDGEGAGVTYTPIEYVSTYYTDGIIRINLDDNGKDKNLKFSLELGNRDTAVRLYAGGYTEETGTVLWTANNNMKKYEALVWVDSDVTELYLVTDNAMGATITIKNLSCISNDIDNNAFQAAINATDSNITAVPFTPGIYEDGYIDRYSLFGWTYGNASEGVTYTPLEYTSTYLTKGIIHISLANNASKNIKFTLTSENRYYKAVLYAGGYTEETGTKLWSESYATVHNVDVLVEAGITDLYLVTNNDSGNSYPVTISNLSYTSNDTGGNGGSNENGVIGPKEEAMTITGTVQPITTMDITLELDGISFAIDSDRKFTGQSGRIINSSSFPIDVYLMNIEGKTGTEPAIVENDMYTEKEWNNLSVRDTLSYMAISINELNLSQIYNNNELDSSKMLKLGNLKSAYNGDTSLELVPSALYGKNFGNIEEMNVLYDLVIEFIIP